MTGLLRVRNEARWIERCIRSIQPLCDRVLVMDDHSEDDTREICAAIPDVTVLPSPFTGLQETRDKNWLLSQAGNPDWVFMIDGDEMLDPAAIPIVRAAISSAYRAFDFKILYLWDSEDQVRVDRLYSRFRRPSLFRFGAERFTSPLPSGFHCGNVPRELQDISRPLNASLLHFGYMYKEDRIRKYHWYRAKDKENAGEDGYRHCAQGDLPEIPATATLMHAGPLKLEALCSLAA